MPKEHWTKVYEYLFTEGVMVAEKNTKLKSHPELADVPNLHVMTVLKSLKSRGHVDETFTWRHAYYRLNNTGITYLRETLHLPAEIVPATLKKQATAAPAGPAGRRPDMRQGGRGGERGGDRGDYRRGPAGDKTADAGAGAAPMEFRGMGRGRRPAPQ